MRGGAIEKTQSTTGGQTPVVTTELSMRDVFINVDGECIGEVIEFRCVKQITAYFKTNKGIDCIGTYSSFSNAKRAIINKWKSGNRKGQNEINRKTYDHIDRYL